LANQKLPYWRLSGFYFFYFASLGALTPYLGLYLNSIGYMAVQVGLVFAVMQGTKLVSPSILAWISSGFNDRMRLIQLASFVSAAAYTCVLFEQEFVAILLIFFVFSFFWNAMLPQFEAVTLTKLAQRTNLYSGIRLWGSVGFVVTVLGVGYVLTVIGLDEWPLLVSLCLVMIFLSSLLLSEKGRKKHPTKGPTIYSILSKKAIVAFFMVVFLMQASHGAYYAFFSILLDKLDYNETEIGLLWSLGVFAEIAIFIIIQKLFHHLQLRFVLLLSIFLTIIRWLIIAWLAESLVALLVAQLLHAASFGSFHVVCIQLTHHYFKGAAQDKGQALYTSIGYGAGGMFGGLLAGFLWDGFGSQWVFTMASFLSAIAFFVAWNWVERGNSEDLAATGEGISSV